MDVHDLEKRFKEFVDSVRVPPFLKFASSIRFICFAFLPISVASEVVQLFFVCFSIWHSGLCLAFNFEVGQVNGGGSEGALQKENRGSSDHG